MDKPDDLLTLDEIAPLAAVGLGSIRTMHGRATRRRREERNTDLDLPAPDLRLGRTPVWYRRTVEEWLSKRGRK